MAHDPILAQEITNGHAARMRYSRFRASMLGLEPQRRNRTGATAKAKVTKAKKEAKPKKEGAVKPDPTPASPRLSAIPEAAPASPGVKRELAQGVVESQLPLAPSMTPMPDHHSHLHTRLLTPCSDTDLLGTPQGYAAPSPVSDMLHPEPVFDFAAAACAHEHVAWAHGSPYQAFGMPYEMDGYAAAFCEHPHQSPDQQAHHPAEGGVCVPSAVMKQDSSHMPIKDEEWDTRYHEI